MRAAADSSPQGFNTDLDCLRSLRRGGRGANEALTARLAEEAGIPRLKVRHNQVIGRDFDLTPVQVQRLQASPKGARFIHHQTPENSVRFSTAELAMLEAKLNDTSGQALACEPTIFPNLCAAVTAEEGHLRACARTVAECDLVVPHADLTRDRGWGRAEANRSNAFKVEAARHSMVEAVLATRGRPFVANGADLSGGQIWLLTGPNMVGKAPPCARTPCLSSWPRQGCGSQSGVCNRLFSCVSV